MKTPRPRLSKSAPDSLFESRRSILGPRTSQRSDDNTRRRRSRDAIVHTTSSRAAKRISH
jgi:hypothetical protein